MDKIIGNIVGVPNPQPDWNQTDKRKADYIKNKPNVLKADEDLTLTNHSIHIEKTPDHEGDVSLFIDAGTELNVDYGKLIVKGNDVTDNLSQLNGVVEELTYHLDHSTNNPHNVTAEQIGASSLSRNNTFTEENIFNSIVRINGAFEGGYDTYVSGLQGERYNVFDELAKIESINGVSLNEDNEFTGDNTFNILRANEIQAQGIEYQYGVAHQGLSVGEYLSVGGQAEFDNDIKVKGVNVAEELAKIGDIETALDNIIAIQNGYIGGVSE